MIWWILGAGAFIALMSGSRSSAPERTVDPFADLPAGYKTAIDNAIKSGDANELRKLADMVEANGYKDAAARLRAMAASK